VTFFVLLRAAILLTNCATQACYALLTTEAVSFTVIKAFTPTLSVQQHTTNERP